MIKQSQLCIQYDALPSIYDPIKTIIYYTVLSNNISLYLIFV